MGALKLSNSWGNNWGNNGFIWVAYDSLNLVSCVENAPYHESREKTIGEVAGISVMKKGTDAQLFVRYTLNTADRTQVRVNILAEKDGTIYSSRAISNEFSGPKIAYDGSKEATDATMVTLLSNCVPGITSENFSDYSFSVQFVDENNDSKPFIVKNCEIVDKNLNKIYKMDNVFPLTLDGSERTVKFTESDLNHAVVYYRGYKNPSINYKFTGSSFQSDEVLMETTAERRGYTHKYVIDLKDKNEVKLYFTDSNNSADNNNGGYFTAKKGLNYFVTENVSDPVIINITNNFDSINDVNNLSNFAVEASGGYGPYLYKYTAKNLDSGKEEIIDYTEKNTTGFYLREIGKYRITVDVKDFSDSVTTAYADVEIKNLPFEFESLTSDSAINHVGDEIRFVAKSKNEQIKYTGKVNNEYTFEIKDSSGNTVFTNTKKGDSCNMNYRYTQTAQTYTPSKSGVYTIKVSSTDANKEYAEKTLTFTVFDKIIGDADGNGDVNIMDATIIQQYLATIITKEHIYIQMANCDENSDVNIMDATRIQLYLAKKENYGNVGNVIEFIPPTEPPTTAPTVAPTQKPTEAPKTNKVTFTNSLNWNGTLHCYYWSDENTTMTSWPGQSMTNSGTNEFAQTLYTFDVPADATYIIFTNGSSQTVDIKYNGGEVRYYALNTKTGNGFNVETW